MRCTGKSKRYLRARKRRNRIVRIMVVFFILQCVAAAGIYYLKNNSKEEHLAAEYESSHYDKALYKGDFVFGGFVCRGGGRGHGRSAR